MAKKKNKSVDENQNLTIVQKEFADRMELEPGRTLTSGVDESAVSDPNSGSVLKDLETIRTVIGIFPGQDYRWYYEELKIQGDTIISRTVADLQGEQRAYALERLKKGVLQFYKLSQA